MFLVKKDGGGASASPLQKRLKALTESFPFFFILFGRRPYGGTSYSSPALPLKKMTPSFSLFFVPEWILRSTTLLAVEVLLYTEAIAENAASHPSLFTHLAALRMARLIVRPNFVGEQSTFH